MKRLRLVAWNVAYNLTIPFFSLLFSILIINFNSSLLWGEIVSYLLVAVGVNQLISWGQKEFLLKTFSRRPADITPVWQENVSTRSLLVLIMPIVFGLIYEHAVDGIHLSLLVLAIFLYRTFDPLTLYFKRFRPALFIEIIGSLIVAGGILWYQQGLTAHVFLRLLIVSYLIRVWVYMYLFRREIFASFRWKLNFHQLKQALPYLLLTLMGFLANQVNTYSMAFLENHDQLGKFQVLITFFIFLANGSYFMIQPFMKNLIRVRQETYGRIVKEMFLLGLFISLLGGICIAIFIPLLYAFDFPIEVYVLGIFYAMPQYYYITKNINLIRHNQELVLLMIGCCRILLAFILCMLLIPPLGITGAMIAACTGAWLVVLIHVIMDRYFPRAEEGSTTNHQNKS